VRTVQVHHKPALAARLAQLARALVYELGPEAPARAAVADEAGRFGPLWPSAATEAVVVSAGGRFELTLLGASGSVAAPVRLLAPTPYCYDVNETGHRFGDADGAGRCCDRAAFTLHRRSAPREAVACAAAERRGDLLLRFKFGAQQWGEDARDANPAAALDGATLRYAWSEWPPCLAYGHNGLPMPPFALLMRALPSQPGRLALVDATEDAQLFAELVEHTAPLA
jgi:hypothetical protein